MLGYYYTVENPHVSTLGRVGAKDEGNQFLGQAQDALNDEVRIWVIIPASVYMIPLALRGSAAGGEH